MSKYTQQYQPISNAETCYQAPLTVRFSRDMADNINNTKRYVQNFKVRSLVEPGQGINSDYAWRFAGVEQTICVFAPTDIPHGYTNYHWSMGHKMDNAAGNVVWRLYSTDKLYRGSTNVSMNYYPNYSVANIVTTSNTYSTSTTQNLNVVRDRAGSSCLMLTAEPSNTDVRAVFYTLDIWPVF